MAQFLLDTNIISFLVKKSTPALDHRVSQAPWMSLAISTITEAELRFGTARLPPEARLHHIVGELLRDLRIDPWDSASAQQYASLAAALERAGKPLSNFDTMIAAHAMAHDFTLVTNDAAFRRVPGLNLEDWTKGPRYP